MYVLLLVWLLKNILIVGYRTANTLPIDFSNNSNRELWCLSRTSRDSSTNNTSIRYFTNPKELYIGLLERYYNLGDIDRVFVFGGSEFNLSEIFKKPWWNGRSILVKYPG